MNIFFRTDVSYEIGTGHLMRCLTLADRLQSEGAEITFICRDHPGFDGNIIKDHGFELILLEYSARGAVNASHENIYTRWLAYPWNVDRDQTISAIAQTELRAEWLVADHYGIDHEWQSGLRRAVDNIMVIDDLANRKHDCDLLLDQNCHVDYKSRYDELVSPETVKLLGPDFAMLRPEFTEVRSGGLAHRIENRVFVFFGGADLTNETQKTIEALNEIDIPWTADIVVGSANRNRETIEKLCRDNPDIIFHTNIKNMAELMAKASLAVGAGGTTTYERAALGLPTIFIAIADNQISVSRGADFLGLGKYLGESSNVSRSELSAAIELLLTDPKQLQQISLRAADLVDGFGVNRVVGEIIEKVPTESV